MAAIMGGDEDAVRSLCGDACWACPTPTVSIKHELEARGFVVHRLDPQPLLGSADV